MIVSAIVAAAENNAIGRHNQIPWYLSEDLKYFKRTTLDHFVIMGRRSFESIGRPLPRRTNVIITRDPFYAVSGCLVARSVEEALTMALNAGETEAFIIGGGEIYRQSLPYWDKLYLTRVEAVVEGEVFFPEPDWTQWRRIADEPHPADEKNDFPFRFQVFERIFNEEEEE
ncbi:MAG: dihydrofolate reductase [Lewinella sp.]|nr:dihydrofolate reductase [Lewinella sp.]